MVAARIGRSSQDRADSGQNAQAYWDITTSLPNRRCLIEGLDQALAERPENASVAFVHIDPKGFKEINETLGHHGGDQLLAAIAARLRQGLPAEALLGRLGETNSRSSCRPRSPISASG